MLVEVHDAQRAGARARRLGAEIIGINNRDLRDFSVDVERTFALIGADARAGSIVVSESGIAIAGAARGACSEHGVQAVLVGETLMRGRGSRRGAEGR